MPIFARILSQNSEVKFWTRGQTLRILLGDNRW